MAENKIGRNADCLCGSGKKYKKCCALAHQAAPSLLAREKECASLLQTALTLHRAGQLNQAYQLYQQILALDPRQADALHLCGMAAYQGGEAAVAERYLRQAIAIKPAEKMFLLNLASVLQARGDAEGAVECLQQVLALAPTDAAAANNLGNILQAQGRLDEAIAWLSRALALNSGASMVGELELEALLAGITPTAARHPDVPMNLVNLGSALQARGRLTAAAACLAKAVACAPQLAVAHSNWGGVLHQLGQSERAVAVCRQAIALDPGSATAQANLGNALKDRGRLGEAEACYREAIRLEPQYALAYFNLADVLLEQGEPQQARQWYEQGITLAPGYAEGFSNYLFALLHDESLTPQEIQAAHARFAERFETPRRLAWGNYQNTPEPARRLRVGFVSGDLRHHALAGFIEPVWRALANSSLEVWVYSNTPVEDEVSLRLRELVVHWQPVYGLPDTELVQQIRADGIDILIDLSGHTGFNRLLALAHKPAPIQVSWIGYPGTTGLASVDYLLCDPFNAPFGLYERFYSEKFARLPSTGAFAPDMNSPSVSPLPALTNGYVTFGSFNRPHKIGAAVLAAWAEVMRAVPESRFIAAHISDVAQQQRLTQAFADHGIAAERLRFVPKLSMPEYLALHQQIDLLLDTWPYTGGTTTNHALWMGVPVVTLRGPSRCHCQSAAIMGRIGLEAWGADDVAGYVRIAIDRASDVSALAELRSSLRQRWQSSPWRDSAAISGWLEQGLRAMWQRWCQGLPPEHFQITAAGDVHV